MSKIIDLKARSIWDSRGRAIVEAELFLEGGFAGRGVASSGASTGAGQAKVVDVAAAMRNIRGEIRGALLNSTADDQESLDTALINLDGRPDKSRLGGNALVAVSLAYAHASAAAAGVPLWRHLAGDRPVALPVPHIQIFGGGVHAGGRVDIQDYMVIATGAGSFTEALEMTAEVYHAAGARLLRQGTRQGVADLGGYWPVFKSNEAGLAALVQAIEDAGMRAGPDIAIALDIGATQIYRAGRYQLALESRALDPEQWQRMLLRWIDAYPIVSIEDPFEANDGASLLAFTCLAGTRVQIAGDDCFCTNAARIRKGIAAGAGNAVVIKPAQAGTVSEARAAWAAASAGGYGGIAAARSGETEDASIVHLAAGWGVPQLKVGGFARAERMAKWNEGLRIEEFLGRKAALYPARKLFEGRLALRRT